MKKTDSESKRRLRQIEKICLQEKAERRTYSENSDEKKNKIGYGARTDQGSRKGEPGRNPNGSLRSRKTTQKNYDVEAVEGRGRDRK